MCTMHRRNKKGSTGWLLQSKIFLYIINIIIQKRKLIRKIINIMIILIVIGKKIICLILLWTDEIMFQRFNKASV